MFLLIMICTLYTSPETSTCKHWANYNCTETPLTNWRLKYLLQRAILPLFVFEDVPIQESKYSW